ncbi:MAG: hypothetical protein ACYDHU_05165 [Acidimicrobiales bacterium]
MSIITLANICVTVGHGTLARILAVGIPWLLLAAAVGVALWWRHRSASKDAAATSAEAISISAAAHDHDH